MTIVAAVVAFLTLLGMLTRPRGVSEAVCAGVGGLAMLASTVVSPSAAWREVRGSADILLFLLGMMILTTVVESSGVFDYLAEGCAKLAFASGSLLLANTLVHGAF